MKINKNNKGVIFEKQAAKYLKKQGYKIINTNYHSKFGEVDIIAQKDDCIVFVEVKGRTTNNPNPNPNSNSNSNSNPNSNSKMKTQMANVKGYQFVNQNKINKLIKTSQIYMIEHNYNGLARFDVVSIDNGHITHIINAFGL